MKIRLIFSGLTIILSSTVFADYGQPAPAQMNPAPQTTVQTTAQPAMGPTVQSTTTINDQGATQNSAMPNNQIQTNSTVQAPMPVSQQPLPTPPMNSTGDQAQTAPAQKPAPMDVPEPGMQSGGTVQTTTTTASPMNSTTTTTMQNLGN